MTLFNDLLLNLLLTGFISQVVGYLNACISPYWLFYSCQFAFRVGFGDLYFGGLDGSASSTVAIPGLIDGTLFLPF